MLLDRETGADGHVQANNRLRLVQESIDFAYRSTHEMTLKAKQLVQAFYDKPPQRSYLRDRPQVPANAGRRLAQCVSFPWLRRQRSDR